MSGANGQTLGMATDQAAFNIGVGVSAGSGEVEAKWDLIDINGDGLPDYVRPAGGGLEVRLNLGYRFGAVEQWGGLGTLRFERTGNVGASANVGIAPAGSTDPEYGFGGGISATDSRSAAERDLIDVNGDGLPDLVFKPVSTLVESDSPNIEVRLNTGAGFLPPQTWTGLLPEPVQKRSTISGNLGFHFTISIPLSPAGPFLIINPGYNGGDQFGRAQTQVRNFDGDGYPDHLFSDTSGNVRANLNRHGRTNLLKDIRRPLGATIALDYERAGNTPEHPQRRWVLASRTVFDGFVRDGAENTDPDRQGADYQIATFTYADGRWDRAERTFYGFRTVREQQRNTTGITEANLASKPLASLPIYRSSVQTFRTDSFYTKMLLERQVTEDEHSAPFLETAQAYTVVNVVKPTVGDTAITGLEDFTATRFPQLIRRDRRFFEGQPAPGKQTAETFAYDDFGNTTAYTDVGDDGPEDDVVATVRYTASDPACLANYIVGIADRIRVTDTAGAEFRRRESTVDCTTGNVTQMRRFLANGSAAVTDMVYDDQGRLSRFTGPANAGGAHADLGNWRVASTPKRLTAP